MNQVLNSAANSGPSVGASSLVTDANSALSGGAQLQRSASNNTDSFMRLPASPMSFSSGNISVSGSSVMDGSSLAQQSGSSITRLESNQDQAVQQQQFQPRQQQGASTPTSQQKMQQTSQQQVISQQGQSQGTGPQLGVQQMVGQQTAGSGQQLGQRLPVQGHIPPKLETGQGLVSPKLESGQSLISPKLESAQGLITPKLEKNDQYLQQAQMMKPRMDLKQEDAYQQQVVQQILQRPENLLAAHLQRQDSMQRHSSSPQLQVLFQQRMMQQQQLLQSLPQHLQRSHLQQQQQQLRHHMQQHNIQQPTSLSKQPAMESGLCARRLMQYIYHQRHRPSDNNIGYWRKFVAEFFAPNAKKRWCLSLYGNVGHHTLGVFPQAAMDVWQCEICGSKPGRGFETTVEVLPRLCKIKFDSGVIDELLFVDMPQEYRLSSGLMVLEYGKATQESVFEQLRVVRNGQLRIIFTPELKILSWEFCAKNHEELLPRRLVAPQVNQLAMAAQKYQNAAAQSGSSGLSTQDLQANCNMFVTTGRQLARNLEVQSLNDLGFSKRYVRCLQISEVVNSMKDLIDFSRENNMGPIASLNTFPRQTTSNLQSQQIQQGDPVGNIQGLASDHNSIKMNPMHGNMSNHINNHASGTVNNSSHNATALNNYQNLLRQNSMTNSQNALQQEASGSFGGPTQTPPCNSLQSPSHSLPFQGAALSSMPGTLQNTSLIGLSNSIQQNSVGGNLLQQTHPQSSQGNQPFPQHVIQQLLQEMMNNGGTSQQALVGQGLNGNVGNMLNGLTGSGSMGIGSGAVRSGAGMMGNGLGYGSNNISNITGNTGTALGGAGNLISGRSNSFRNIANNSAPVGSIGSSGFGGRLNLGGIAQPQNVHMQDVVQDLPHEFPDNGIFNGLATNGDSGDNPFGWKTS